MGYYISFKKFRENIRMSEKTVNTVRERYKKITRRINEEYWDSQSETDHSYYVGSYGRGTSIHASDIDVVVILPNSIFKKFDSYSSNGQSSLLQDVKNKLRKTYPSSEIKGDGQVVSISFYDGIMFEIVPAFQRDFWSKEMTYPDTHDGGSWKLMDPLKEMDEFDELNSQTKGNLKRLCQMMREWNIENSVHQKGCLIDFALFRYFKYYAGWFKSESYSYYGEYSNLKNSYKLKKAFLKVCRF